MPNRLPCWSRILVVTGVAFASGAAQAAPPRVDVMRDWIAEMKSSAQGPFERIRWFCADGTVLPPKAYACRGHGGGVQHGQWTERVLQMRDAGYEVATVFADLDPAAFIGADADIARLDQILLERFLFQIDDGWIFRGARTYRGALQVEDEEAGARRLVLAMLGDANWLTAPRFFRLRETARLLPLPRDAATAAVVRHQALELAEHDSRFTPLRAKIHNAPDAADAEAVRTYARERAPQPMRDAYESLADAIDALYAAGKPAETLGNAANQLAPHALATQLSAAADSLTDADPAARFAAISGVLARLREAIADAELSPEQRLTVLEASLALEDDLFALGSSLGKQHDASRRTRLERLVATGDALYGIGFISARHLEGVRKSHARLTHGSLTVDRYREELRYLARASEWSGRWLEFNRAEVIARWAPLEPKAHLFTQDRLRGSPLLFYTQVADRLGLDANRLAGIEHDLFGERVGSGLRALNPGLARGNLVAEAALPDGHTAEPGPRGSFDHEGIYLLPESVSDLPRVSGILTRGEGSSLSHVQLLARNLGIPNVVVAEEHVPAVRRHDGRAVVLAVSPHGVVQLVEAGPKWDEIFGREVQGSVEIAPDLEKLDLAPAMIPLGKLRATHSGRFSGPKGANLGELKHHFGSAVPGGFVISFGVFRELLDRPIEPGGPAAFDWMKAEYDRLAGLSEAERGRRVPAFLAHLRAWIAKTDPGPGFHQSLETALARLGPDGSFGAFVRSDTNVEDLPGFTGAGLNLTVPNVVGTANIVAAVKKVWASPFTERAYGWRQSHMTDPEYVFPAVVVQQSFPSEKSGVLVTVDVDTGDPAWLTVAVNEGVGGAVEGQAAESLKIHAATGEVRFMAQATAPRRAELAPTGGVVQVPASGRAQLLTPDEIAKLIEFSRTVGERFPTLRDEAGRTLPADVEFAFRGGDLTLLQIRPFVESKSAKRSGYLSELDARFRTRGAARVDLDAVPAQTTHQETTT